MDDPLFNRITIRQDQMGGVPCIRGLRIPVTTVVAMVADGMTGRRYWTPIPILSKRTSCIVAIRRRSSSRRKTSDCGSDR